MLFKNFARSAILNFGAAAASIGATIFITWIFGLAEFAFYTINLAKLSLIMLGAEALPSSFTIFRLQQDPEFTHSVPVFYAGFAVIAAIVTAVLLGRGWVAHGSWFMILFIFSTTLQRYFDAQAQASGRVDAYFWIPASANIARVVLLAALAASKLLSVPDVLWASVALGSIVGQVIMLSRFPEFFDPNAWRRPVKKLVYLWSIRRSYYGYYVNSVLKRVKDTFLPIFSDLVFPSKAEIGRIFLYTRANEAVCGQIRVLEAFMVNRSVRENLRGARRRIFLTLAPLGHAAVGLIALGLMYREGVRVTDIALAFATGLFIYPYILELFWRNDALASFRPNYVTISLVAFIAGLTIPPLVAYALGGLSIPIMLAGYVAGQGLAAATYRFLPRSVRAREAGLRR